MKLLEIHLAVPHFVRAEAFDIEKLPVTDSIFPIIGQDL
jgi:hypothetical protein